MRYEFFESEYRWELERRERLNDSVSIPFAVVVALGSALGFFLQDITIEDSGSMDAVVMWLILGSAVCLGITIWYLIWCYHSKEYHMIDHSRVWFDHRRLLTAFFATNPLPPNRTLQDEMDEDLIDAYSESARDNREINNMKSKNLYVAKSWLAISLGLVAITTVAFSYRAYSKGEKTHKVEVVSTKTKGGTNAK